MTNKELIMIWTKVTLINAVLILGYVHMCGGI